MSVALVTGASRGLGRALAGELAARGWDLVLSARGAPALEEVAAGLAGAAGGRVVAVAGDVSSGAHRAALVAAARELGGLDLLVNNAGVLGAEPLVPLAVHDLAGLREAFEVNVVMAAAEPGEDLAGLPAPEEVAPALLRLVAERLPSGRYTAERLAAGRTGEAGGGGPGAGAGAVGAGAVGAGAVGAGDSGRAGVGSGAAGPAGAGAAAAGAGAAGAGAAGSAGEAVGSGMGGGR